MRLLVLTPFLPYADAPMGSPRAVFGRLRLLARQHNVTVVTFAQPGERRHIADLKRLGVTVYPVDRPIPPQTVYGRLLKRARLAISYARSTLPLLALEFRTGPMQRLVTRQLTGSPFDAVLVEHVLMAQYVDARHHRVPFILSDHDVRAALSKPQHDGIKTRIMGMDARRWRRYLAHVWRGADVVTVPSEQDAAFLARIVPGVRVRVVPFGLPTRGEYADEPSAREPHTLLYVGNFDHPPNVSAAVRLAREIFPVVKQRFPGCKLWLVGKNPTVEVTALSADDVVVTGEVPSVEPYLQRATLFVAPIREGGGVRIKLLETMAAGVPVVTTPLGAHGLGATAGEHLIVAGSDDEMAGAVLQLLADPDERHRLSQAGRALACSGAAEQAQIAALEDLLSAAESLTTKRSRA